jgi:hypothetical protein
VNDGRKEGRKKERKKERRMERKKFRVSPSKAALSCRKPAFGWGCPDS